ncbi:basic salivary proline-rich protein 3-like [Candoia aspera]|uniref:basic salivary proline-rich protein 3-like n=1 Tax=Candoia aspera TaxID=51853 RepID=UPI002FD7E491
MPKPNLEIYFLSREDAARGDQMAKRQAGAERSPLSGGVLALLRCRVPAALATRERPRPPGKAAEATQSRRPPAKQARCPADGGGGGQGQLPRGICRRLLWLRLGAETRAQLHPPPPPAASPSPGQRGAPRSQAAGPGGGAPGAPPPPPPPPRHSRGGGRPGRRRSAEAFPDPGPGPERPAPAPPLAAAALPEAAPIRKARSPPPHPTPMTERARSGSRRSAGAPSSCLARSPPSQPSRCHSPGRMGATGDPGPPRRCCTARAVRALGGTFTLQPPQRSGAAQQPGRSSASVPPLGNGRLWLRPRRGGGA